MKSKSKGNSIYVSYISRILDILVSLVAIIILSPIYIIISVILFIFQGRPIIFKQLRAGLNFKEFNIYKFRTMKLNAETLINDFSDEEKNEYYSNYKLRKDTRVTTIGKFLRRTSLDEIPQFINILKGDMSFIGPRPIVKKELEKYSDSDKEKLLSVLPGLIGYWQSYCTKDTTYDKRIQMELYYADNKSFIFDIKIILKSFVTVIKKAIIN